MFIFSRQLSGFNYGTPNYLSLLHIHLTAHQPELFISRINHRRAFRQVSGSLHK